PSGKASSGTEEEFEIAYQAWHSTEHPRILLFFCARPALLNSVEQLEQRSRVLAFRSRVDNIGLVRSFETASEFESLLRNDLSLYLLSQFSRHPVEHSDSPGPRE